MRIEKVVLKRSLIKRFLNGVLSGFVNEPLRYSLRLPGSLKESFNFHRAKRTLENKTLMPRRYALNRDITSESVLLPFDLSLFDSVRRLAWFTCLCFWIDVCSKLMKITPDKIAVHPLFLRALLINDLQLRICVANLRSVAPLFCGGPAELESEKRLTTAGKTFKTRWRYELLWLHRRWQKKLRIFYIYPDW